MIVSDVVKLEDDISTIKYSIGDPHTTDIFGLKKFRGIFDDGNNDGEREVTEREDAWTTGNEKD